MRLALMVSIMDRDKLAEFLSIYQANGLETHFISLAHGTAPNAVLGALGLPETEKAVTFTITNTDIYKKVKADLRQKMHIDVPGTGIVFTVILSAVGGKREYQYLTAGQNFVQKEESIMKDTKHELLVVISNRGYNDMVMEAARAAGAGGGTVIHAQGTGKRAAEKFFGISLASEKEMLFIVVPTKDRTPVMESIMKSAGLETKAKSIVFSLPVADTAGLRLIEDTVTETAEEN